MKEKRNLHLKVQELCDCYATTDPLKEMSILQQEPDQEDAELRWLALAALHGINSNASKITVTMGQGGNLKVTAEYREGELPSPGSDLAHRIIEALRGITHIEEGKGKSRLALGLRESSVDLEIKVKTSAEGEKVTIKFP